MSAVADHQIFDNVGHGSRINTNAADGYATSFAGAELVEFQNVAAFNLHDLPNSAVHGSCQLSVPPQLPVLTVNRNKISRLHQVDDQLELFLAGVSAHVNRWGRAVFVNHMRLTAEYVINHAVNAFFVAGDNAGREHDRIARFDARVLVVIHGGAGEGGHGLALRTANENGYLFRRVILQIARMNQHSVGNLNVSQILCDLR